MVGVLVRVRVCSEDEEWVRACRPAQRVRVRVLVRVRVRSEGEERTRVCSEGEGMQTSTAGEGEGMERRTPLHQPSRCRVRYTCE